MFLILSNKLANLFVHILREAVQQCLCAKPMQDLCSNRSLYGDRFLHCCMYNCFVDCHLKRLIRTEFKLTINQEFATVLWMCTEWAGLKAKLIWGSFSDRCDDTLDPTVARHIFKIFTDCILWKCAGFTTVKCCKTYSRKCMYVYMYVLFVHTK